MSQLEHLPQFSTTRDLPTELVSSIKRYPESPGLNSLEDFAKKVWASFTNNPDSTNLIIFNAEPASGKTTLTTQLEALLIRDAYRNKKSLDPFTEGGKKNVAVNILRFDWGDIVAGNLARLNHNAELTGEYDRSLNMYEQAALFAEEVFKKRMVFRQDANASNSVKAEYDLILIETIAVTGMKFPDATAVGIPRLHPFLDKLAAGPQAFDLPEGSFSPPFGLGLVASRDVQEYSIRSRMIAQRRYRSYYAKQQALNEMGLYIYEEGLNEADIVRQIESIGLTGANPQVIKEEINQTRESLAEATRRGIISIPAEWRDQDLEVLLQDHNNRIRLLATEYIPHQLQRFGVEEGRMFIGFNNKLQSHITFYPPLDELIKRRRVPIRIRSGNLFNL